MALAIFLVLSILVTLAWVRHNLSVYRRKGPRTQLPAVREAWETDVLGRPVRADWNAVRAADEVWIDVGENAKTYTTGVDDA